MSRLADPSICPDCRGRLAAGRCTVCGLVLQGPDASRLWQLLLEADGLVTRLRHAAPQPVPQPVPPPVQAPYPAPAPPPASPPAPPRRRGGIAAAGVPVVLLGLGGLCLVVFAAIFLSQSWDALGLWGRTLVVLGITGTLAGVAVLVTVKGLRASAETLWVVVALMLAFDLYAASAADLLVRDLSGRTTSTVVGLVLVALGAGVATWARRTSCGRLASPQLVLVLGVAVLTVAQALTRGEPTAPAAVLVPLLLASAWLWRRLDLVWAAGATALFAAGVWALLVLAGGLRSYGISVSDPAATHGPLWWWPLVLAASYAAVLTLLPRAVLGTGERSDHVVRGLAAAAAIGPLLLLTSSTVLVDSPRVGTAIGCVVLVALSGLLTLGGTWGRGAAPYVVIGALYAVLDVAGGPLLPIGDSVFEPGVGRGGGLGAASRIDAFDPTLVLALPVALSAAVAVAALLGVVGPGLSGLLGGGSETGRSPAVVATAGAAATSLLALGAWSTVLGLEPLLWTAVLAGLLAAAATAWATWEWRRELPACLIASASTAWTGLLVTAVAFASGSALLAAMVLTTLSVPLLAVGLLRDRVRAATSAVVLLGSGALVLAFAVDSWASWFEASPATRAAALTTYAGLLLLAARPLTRLASSRLALKVAAAPVVLAALLVDGRPESGTVVLGVAAAAIALAAALRQDRQPLGWAAATLAVVAAAWRLLADLPLPEAPTLVVGALLLVPGALRLRGEPDLESTPALGLGLALAVVPSLLLALGDPVSLRGLLVGLAAVALVLVGVLARLAAPFVVGAVATGLLALRHLGPLVEAMERWIVIGIVGAVLLVAGITWEAGLRNLGRARRYVVSLR